MNETHTHDQITFQWRDAESLLVHEVSAEVVDGSPDDSSLQALLDDATTLCGIQIVGEFDSVDDNVTCALCLEGDWLSRLGHQLGAPDAVSEPTPIRHEPAEEPVSARAMRKQQ